MSEHDKAGSDPLVVSIRLFAAVADHVGERQLVWKLPAQARLRDLQQEFVNHYPDLEPLLAMSRWAVAGNFAQPDQVLDEAAEVAIIPPVSGG